MKKKKGLSSPQMSDIAELAGVSKSTVSRALADSPLVNESTKALIKKIAREQNYRLDTAAANFRMKKAMTIAVLLPSAKDAHWKLSDPFFLELVGAIAEAVDAHGHQLLLSRTSPQDGKWIEEFIYKRSSDGIILIGQGSQHEAINSIAKTYKAISVWGAKISNDQNYPVVGTDNHLGGYKATRHLLDKGRRKIAIVGNNGLPEMQERYQGYLKALQEYDLSTRPELELNTNISDTYLAITDLLKRNAEFDSIFAITDFHAMACIQAIQAHGRKVPDDIAVVGFDDLQLSAFYNPPLTTIHQNLWMGGKILVDNLLEAIDGREPELITLDPKLIVRESA